MTFTRRKCRDRVLQHAQAQHQLTAAVPLETTHLTCQNAGGKEILQPSDRPTFTLRCRSEEQEVKKVFSATATTRAPANGGLE
jgi:hypothetical protein